MRGGDSLQNFLPWGQRQLLLSLTKAGQAATHLGVGRHSLLEETLRERPGQLLGLGLIACYCPAPSWLLVAG